MAERAARTQAALALAQPLPALRIAAERVAASVAAGLHGRRRVGTGEAFWQYRAFVAGDPAARIDWRRSARSDRLYVRESELETAQTACLWCSGSAGMRWRSTRDLPEKRERALLLLLALAALLARGGERMRLIAANARPFGGLHAVDRLAHALDDFAASDAADREWPPDLALPRHARLVLFSDFLLPAPELTALIGRLAASGAPGHLVQVLDPAEPALPFEGRVRFAGLGAAAGLRTVVPHVGSVRDAYQQRFASHQDALGAAVRAAGWTLGQHRTDQPAAPALRALYLAMTV